MRIIEGNRRKVDRSSILNSFELCEIVFDQIVIKEATLSAYDHGYLELTINPKFENTVKQLQLTGFGRLQAITETETLIDSKWKIVNVRKESDSFTLCFEHEKRLTLQKFNNLFSPELLWSDSRSKLFSHDSIEFNNFLGKHLTEIKSSTEKPKVKIHLSDTIESAHFDFSDNSANLTNVALTIEKIGPHLIKGLEVSIEYVHYCTRYAFQTHIEEVDQDFNLVIIDLPKEIISSTDRRFHRWDCLVKCNIVNENGGIITGTITDISASGFSISLDPHDKTVRVLEAVKLSILGETEIEISCFVCNVKHSRIGVQLVDLKSNFKKIALFLGIVLSGGKELRTKDNYCDYLDLYIDVGYGPATPDKLDSWKHKTSEVWQSIDNLLPGNTFGVREESQLVTSFGVVPISSNLIYGHSLAMRKTKASITNLFQLLTISFWWSDFIDGVDFYAGAARHSSKFTSRFFTSFEMCPNTSSHIITSSKFEVNFNDLHDDKAIELNLTTEEETIEFKSKKLNFFKRNMFSRNDLTTQFVNFQVFKIDASERTMGYLYCSSAIPFYTAANIFDVCFILSDSADELQISSICSAMKRKNIINTNVIEIVGNESKAFEGAIKCIPKEWYIVHKSEFGAIISSIRRSIDSVLKKYGEV